MRKCVLAFDILFLEGALQGEASGRDFKIILEGKGGSGQQVSVHLIAPTIQEKAAWISDISQVFTFFLSCIYNTLVIWVLQKLIFSEILKFLTYLSTIYSKGLLCQSPSGFHPLDVAVPLKLLIVLNFLSQIFFVITSSEFCKNQNWMFRFLTYLELLSLYSDSLLLFDLVRGGMELREFGSFVWYLAADWSKPDTIEFFVYWPSIPVCVKCPSITSGWFNFFFIINPSLLVWCKWKILHVKWCQNPRLTLINKDRWKTLPEARIGEGIFGDDPKIRIHLIISSV